MTLRVLSAGAAKGLVTALVGAEIDGIFSAVGAIREKFLAGEACDVLILTASQLAELEQQGALLSGSVAALGAVRTGVAVPEGYPVPPIGSGEAFAASVGAASAIYLPDPVRSTAGIHVRGVLERLGLLDSAQARLRAFPNGETAMRALSREAPPGAIGCTQVTEILNTPGLRLVGPLPPGYGLSTVYSAAVSTRAADPAAAADLVMRLTGPRVLDLRRQCGFDDAA